MKQRSLRMSRWLALLILVIFASGCVMAPVAPPLGGVCTNLQAPLALDCRRC